MILYTFGNKSLEYIFEYNEILKTKKRRGNDLEKKNSFKECINSKI